MCPLNNPIGGSLKYAATNIVSNQAWSTTMTDINCSSVVGAYPSLLWIEILNLGATSKYFMCRRNGSTAEHAGAADVVSNYSSVAVAQNASTCFVVITDSSGIFEMKQSNTTENVTVTIRAWSNLAS